MNAIDKTISTDITLGHLLDAAVRRPAAQSVVPDVSCAPA